MGVLQVTESDFQEKVLNAEKPVLVDFWAAWCGPCKMMAPIVDQVAEENDQIQVVKVNTDENQEIAKKYGIMSIPTFILFEKGQVKETTMGYMPKEELEKLFK